MDRIRRLGVKLHLAAAALPLLFAAALGWNGVQSGFLPRREAYPPAVVGGGRIFDQVRRIFDENLAGRVVLILGLVDRPGLRCSADEAGVRLAARLAREPGVEVRVADPQHLDCARKLLGNAVRYFEEPYSPAEGADAVVLMTPWPGYRALDFDRLGERMRNRLFLDGPLLSDSSAAHRAGFRFVSAGSPAWPAWLDPEMREFADQVARRVPARATPQAPRANGILLFPRLFRTLNPRARWYLYLNYHLLPRRLYLIRAELANGTIGQYQEWIESCRVTGTVQGAELQQAAARRKAGWLILYNQWVDFLLEDFELVRLDARR